MNIFENHSFIDPRIPFIFHNYSLPSSYNSNQTMNWHENIELLYFRGGRATARIGGYTVKASKGDIIVVNSNLLHGVIAHSKLEFYCLIIDRSFCLSNHLDIGSMDFEAVIRDNDIAEELEK